MMIEGTVELNLTLEHGGISVSIILLGDISERPEDSLFDNEATRHSYKNVSCLSTIYVFSVFTGCGGEELSFATKVDAAIERRHT